ncbi:MAG: fibronectin type III domain-containing protein, partial [Eubacterium sp.]|nr:fibronectin type III domain-containing protein [Eubacterium sp.]
CTGYQIQLATNKKFTKNVKTVTVKGKKNTARTVKKLKAGKKYFVRVRTYKAFNGTKLFSKWSKVKYKTTK